MVLCSDVPIRKLASQKMQKKIGPRQASSAIVVPFVVENEAALT